jgi:hypothetical protein
MIALGLFRRVARRPRAHRGFSEPALRLGRGTRNGYAYAREALACVSEAQPAERGWRGTAPVGRAFWHQR